MVESIGTTFPSGWQYGKEEIDIFHATIKQVDLKFPSSRNLVINTTWFGPQFNNNEWQKILDLNGEYDNLFLLAVIDPIYLTKPDQDFIIEKFKIKNVYFLGMFADSPYEWNFHAAVMSEKSPNYTDRDLLLDDPVHRYLLYQRKPRLHRIEITKILVEQGMIEHGIVTLGNNDGSTYDWSQGTEGPVLVIDDSPSKYHHNGKTTDYAGIPNDLVSLGRIDIWKNHFLNIVSETEFDNWQPRFVTEKTWKPIIGMRPFVIHGQTSIYQWLRKNGFHTFNHYWPHVPIEESEDQHGNVMSVLHWLCDMDKESLISMYQDMLPSLRHNRERFLEFGREQYHKIHHLFDEK